MCGLIHARVRVHCSHSSKSGHETSVFKYVGQPEQFTFDHVREVRVQGDHDRISASNVFTTRLRLRRKPSRSSRLAAPPRYGRRPSASTFSPSVEAFIEPPSPACKWNSEDGADTKECRHRNRSSGFDLLPMPRREAKRDHVFLAETAFFS